MGIYEKIIASNGKMPRKIKKRIKKIPVGDYCYGSTIGDKRKGGCCTYFHSNKPSLEGNKQAYCGLLNKVDDWELTDQVKICGEFEVFFPKLK